MPMMITMMPTTLFRVGYALRSIRMIGTITMFIAASELTVGAGSSPSAIFSKSMFPVISTDRIAACLIVCFVRLDMRRKKMIARMMPATPDVKARYA